MGKKLKEKLIEEVINQIKDDIEYKEIEPIEELLRFIPIVNLIDYLPETFHETFKTLRDENPNT